MQETYLCKTDLGEIEISRTILAHAILSAVNQMDGQVLVTSKKGELLTAGGKRGSADETDCLEIDDRSGALVVRVYLAVRFGLSMKQVTDSLAGKIRKNMLKEVGVAPASAIIHVTGTLAKKMAPRDIEYRIDYED